MSSSMLTLLPNAPDAVVDDRFSLLDSDEEFVPLWNILETLLARSVHEPKDLVELLDTLHCTIGHDYQCDYGFLINFLRKDELGQRFFSEIWPIIVKLILDTPRFFVDGYIKVLNLEELPYVRLTRPQCACLIAHQFICSIPRPRWYPHDRSHDFSIWYKGDQPHANIVNAYLKGILQYFLQQPFSRYSETSVIFLLASVEPNVFTEARESNITVLKPQYTESAEAYFPTAKQVLVEGSYNVVEVVSANKDIGFGRSGSQEEILVGTSPEACPAVLFTTTLEPTEVFIVEGALAVTSVIGYNRTARLNSLELFPNPAEEGWCKRTLLFMDALELDGHDGIRSVPDLLPGNVAREYGKAFAAFTTHGALDRSQPFGCIVSPLWGCGAFCGDPQVKVLIMLCAASLSRIPQFHIFNTKDRKSIQKELDAFVEFTEKQPITVGFVLGVLESIPPSDIASGRSAFEQVQNRWMA